MNIKGNQI